MKNPERWNHSGASREQATYEERTRAMVYLLERHCGYHLVATFGHAYADTDAYGAVDDELPLPNPGEPNLPQMRPRPNQIHLDEPNHLPQLRDAQ